MVDLRSNKEKGIGILLFDDTEEYSYMVKIYTAEGYKYFFNERTFVVHSDYAKRYTSLQSAQRVARKVKKRGYSTQIVAERLEL